MNAQYVPHRLHRVQNNLVPELDREEGVPTEGPRFLLEHLERQSLSPGEGSAGQAGLDDCGTGTVVVRSEDEREGFEDSVAGDGGEFRRGDGGGL